jgi:uncharacterized protein (TIGR02466 family)
MILQELIPFRTEIFSSILEDDISWLIPKIMELQKDYDSNTISNVGGWQSKKYGYEDLSYMKPLIQDIAQCISPIYKRMGIERDILLANYWFNINPRHSYNVTHNHPGCYYSAVLYLKAPKNSGNIRFIRPDKMKEFIPEGTLTEYNWGEYFMFAEKNLLVIFPSWVEHYVEQNRTEEEDDTRISIAFNFK